MQYLMYAFYAVLYVLVVLILARAAGFTRDKPTPTNNLTITGPYKRTKRARSAWLD